MELFFRLSAYPLDFGGRAHRLGENVKNIARGKLYAVHTFLAHGRHPLPGTTPFLDSVGLGENGGFAEYLVVDAANLVVVVSAFL